ncbi:MAG: hypothetical protein WAV32_08845 [Halobacteriota archaeon]
MKEEVKTIISEIIEKLKSEYKPLNLNWYAKGVDYAGFSYNSGYGGLEPWGMYPGDIREGTIKIYSVPDKALKGLKFVYAVGEEASWVVFP